MRSGLIIHSAMTQTTLTFQKHVTLFLCLVRPFNGVSNIKYQPTEVAQAGVVFTFITFPGGNVSTLPQTSALCSLIFSFMFIADQ